MQFKILDSLLTALQTISNTYTQVAQAQSCANHVQHIERLLRATCHVTCHVVRRISSAIKFVCVCVCVCVCDIYFSFILLAEQLTNEGGEESGVPGENPWRQASENATY